MKKNIGNKLALYPTPVVVIGAEVSGKVTWTLVAHVGIVAHDRLLISLFGKHYINKGIVESKKMSVNIVTEDWLERAGYCGLVSGDKTDKSKVFEYVIGEYGTPVINDSRLTMECAVEDIYECNGFQNFICSVNATLVDDEMLNAKGQIDYDKLKPVLFEFPTYQYLCTGDVIGPCKNFGKTLIVNVP